jgi:hypothetical protein
MILYFCAEFLIEKKVMSEMETMTRLRLMVFNDMSQCTDNEVERLLPSCGGVASETH